jgi:hypothetical protein
MSDNQKVNLTTLHENIKSGIRAMFTTQAVPTVDYYRRVETRAIVPAVFFEMTAIDNNPESATEQFDGIFRFSAFCIVPFNAQNAKLAVRVLAASLAEKIQGKRWSCPIGRARVTLIEPDDFDPENSEYESVRLDWEQEGLLGDSVFNADGSLAPTSVWLGYSPNVGPGHEADYIPIFPELDEEE